MMDDTNKINNEDNKNNIKNEKTEKNKGKKMLARSKSLGKLRELKKYLKEENNKVTGQKLKVNKINLIDKYISPVIFIHGIIDDVIYNVFKLVDKNQDEENNYQININQENNLNINKTKSDNPIIKNNNFTINLIEEFVYMPTIKNADKTVSFGFYKPKNNKKKFQTIETEMINENNKNKSKKIQAKNRINTKLDTYSNIDIKHSEQKKNEEFKIRIK